MILDSVYDSLTEEIKHWLMSNCADRGRAEELVQLFLRKFELFSYDHAGENISEQELITMLNSLLNTTVEELRPKFLTPYENDPKEPSVEAVIPFKSMLDFILFTEQLCYVNRGFYAASRAVTAINDMEHLLDDWIIDCNQEGEVPPAYEHLVRWYRWWADGVKAKHTQDMELNGLQTLYEVRDLMVNYFERRWGKRIVEYGQDGMFVYSKDSSYIDRLRAKKHGYAHSPVERRQIKDEWGIDENDLKFLIESEEKA